MSFGTDDISDMGIVTLLEFRTRPLDGRNFITTDLVELTFCDTVAEEKNPLRWYPRFLAVVLDQIKSDFLKVQNLWA